MRVLFRKKPKAYCFSLSLWLLFLLLGPSLQAQHPLPISSPLDLLPTNQATHTVQNSGDWTDPNTWSGGVLPGNLAKVLIPSGKTLTVNEEIATRIKIIRNDGTLRFSPTANTALHVETIVQGMMGALEIGTANAPIPVGTTCKITIIDEGDIDLSTDQWEKGLILMGQTIAYGAAKTSWTELAVNPQMGATTLNLKTAPSGWEVGDRIVISGTDPLDPKSDEVATIQAISGSSLTLAAPLTKDHLTPAPDLFVHVANLSRNILIESESTLDTLDRGHIMFMHTLDVDMNHVRIHKMGRTRKDIPIDDWFIGETDEFENGARFNIRGRYSLHFHRGGVSPTLSPGYVRGCVVEDDPGWAYASHSAYVHFDDNVSYNVIGGAFQTEAGDELGSFTNNIAIRTVNEEFPLRFIAPENAPDTRESSQDFAFQGDGFWVHGGGVSLSGNVASGCSGHGFIYWPEGLIEPGNPTGTWRNTFDVANLGFPPLHYDPEITILATGWVKIAGFDNNVTYSSTIGFSSYYLHTTFFGDQREYDSVYIDTLHSTMNHFTAWNIYDTGIQLNFTEKVSFNHVRLVNSDGNTASKGIWASMYRIMDDVAFTNVSIEGFGTGIGLPPNGQVTLSCGNLKNGTNLYIPSPYLKPRDMLIQGLITEADPVFPNPVEIQMEAIFSPPEDRFPAFFLLPDKIILDYGPYTQDRLYFDEQNASYMPLPSDSEPYTMFDGERYILSEFAGKTNQQLQNDYQMSFGGSILPADAAMAHGIVGGKIRAWQNESMNVPVCVDLTKETRWEEINACIVAAGSNKVGGVLPAYNHPIPAACATVSIAEPNAPRFLSTLYPNPTRGQFTLETSWEAYTVAVYAMDGRLVRPQESLRGEARLDATHWPAGMYLVQIKDQHSPAREVRKLIKRE